MFNLVKVVSIDNDKFLVLKDTTSAAELAEALGVTDAQAVQMLNIGEVKVGGEVQTDPNNVLAAAHNWVNRYINGETVTAGIINRLFGTPKAEADFTDDDKLAIAADSTFVPRHSGIISSTLELFIAGTSEWVGSHLGATAEEVKAMYLGDYNKAVAMAEQSILSFDEAQSAPATEVDPAALEKALLENQQPISEGTPAEEVAQDPEDATETATKDVPVEDPTTEEGPSDQAAAIDDPEQDSAVVPVVESGVTAAGERKILVASLVLSNKLMTNVMDMMKTIQDYQQVIQAAIEATEEQPA